MTLSDFGVSTLGIPRSNKCPNCKAVTKFTSEERHNLAECIIYNSAGIWALSHCRNCGWVVKIYPSRINGNPCTKEECEQLIKEIRAVE